MPTTDQNKKRRKLAHIDAEQDQAAAEAAASEIDRDAETDGEETIDIVSTWRRRRRLQIAGVTLALAVLALWFAPSIVAHTPLRNRVLAAAAGPIDGTLSAERASLGWLSPVVLEDVQVRDAEGKPVLRVPTISGDTTLWSLLTNRSQLGRLQLVKPQIQVTLSDHSSNLEQVFAAWLNAEQEKSLVCPGLELEIIDGTLTLDDVPSRQHWQLEKLGVTLKLAQNWAEPLTLAVSVTLQQPDRAAQLKGQLQIERSVAAGGSPIDQGELTIDSHDVPLKLAEPFLRRTYPDGELSGWLSAKTRLDWEDAGSQQRPTLNVDGTLKAEDLALAGLFAGRDELRLAHVSFPCRGTLGEREVTIQSCSLECDLGKATLQGPIQLPLGEATLPRLLEALSRETYGIDGQIDLAQLATLLPETLRIREGTQITSGQVGWQLSRQSNLGEARWEGRIETSNLVANNQGQQLTWQKPVLVTFAAHDGERGVVIDKLDCQSSFLTLEAAGTLDKMAFTANYDLNRLADELGQFVDLRGVELAGDGWTYLTCQRTANGGIEADGEFQVRKFRLAGAADKPWTEENLVINATLTGQADERRLRQIDAATLKVESQPDLLTMRLLQPVADPGSASAWPVEFKLQGQLATWLPRLEPWLGKLEGWKCSGQCDVQGAGLASADSIDIEQARCHVAQLRALGRGLRIDEPDVEIKLAGKVSRKDSSANFSKLTLASSTLSFNAQDVTAAFPPGETPHVMGIVAYAADVSRLQQCTLLTAEPPLWQLSGQLQGQLKIAAAGGQTTADIDTQLDNLTATRPDEPPWQEAQIRLVGKGRYDRAGDSIELERFQVASSMLKCDAAGRIAELSRRRDLEVTGRLDYDHEKLFTFLQPYLGQGMQIAAGRESRPFALRGPLAALSAMPVADGVAPAASRSLIQEFSGEAGFGWTGANVYGFRVGSGELRGKLADGVLSFSPLDLAASEGRVTASPRIRFWPEPAEFLLGKGPFLEQVRISPEMCEAGLKYVAPVLAGVSQAEGKFSVSMEGCRLPLDEPAKGDLAGTMTVHSVEIAPGPLVRELAVLLERPNSIAKLTRESVVPFRMVQGRIYHRDLELVFPELTIRTHGSVGLDQSLAILAEMPVPPKWIGNNALGASLKDQTIKLPIGGTLNRPQIDAKALEQVSRQFLTSGAKNLLLDGLNKGFDRLFQPQPPPPAPNKPQE